MRIWIPLGRWKNSRVAYMKYRPLISKLTASDPFAGCLPPVRLKTLSNASQASRFETSPIFQILSTSLQYQTEGFRPVSDCYTTWLWKGTIYLSLHFYVLWSICNFSSLRARFTNSLHQRKPSFGIKIVLSGFTKDAQWRISAEKAWTVFLRSTLLNMHL